MSTAVELRAWRHANPELVRAQQKAQYGRDREKILAYQREYRAINKARIAASSKRRRAARTESQKTEEQRKKRDAAFRRKYGITLADYGLMAAGQGHTCALCDRPKRLVVDHCHTTGVVRGLLCDSCNSALGKLGDNADGLRKALEYVSRAR